MKRKVFLFSALAFFATSWVFAEDWPEWRGRGRAGVWSESGILATFPATGLKINWRTPIRNGYSGPAVADGRVFVTDLARQQGNRGPPDRRPHHRPLVEPRELAQHEQADDERGIQEERPTGGRPTAERGCLCDWARSCLPRGAGVRRGSP